MRYLFIIIIAILLGSSIYVFRDSILPEDHISINDNDLIDELTDDYIHPCNKSTNLGNITNIVAESANSFPSPSQEIAYIQPLDGLSLDYNRNRYLYRWQVAETYNISIFDYDKKYPDFTNKLNEYTGFSGGNPDSQRHLKISEQYLTISDSYCGSALVPWNSHYGGLIGSNTTINAIVSNIGEVVPNSISGFRDINEQPILHLEFTDTLTQGLIEYDSYWVEENKENIADNSTTMVDLQNNLKIYATEAQKNRFGNISSVNPDEIDGIWGLKSLPGGENYLDSTNPDADEFVIKHDYYKSILDSNTEISVYDFILLIYSDIQDAVYQGLTDGSLNIDPSQASSTADKSKDKAFWFYNSIKDPSIKFGLKEVNAGFTNMLRSFGIPARPILGFSVGEFYKNGGTPGISSDAIGDDSKCYSNDCDYIKINFENIHLWIEALIPVISSGVLNYHWGIFNPIPDPWILQNDYDDWEYGRNSLGKGKPDIVIQITSGNDIELGSPIDLDTLGIHNVISINEKGQDLEGRVRIIRDGIPTLGEIVELKLFSETELLFGDLTQEFGIQLPSIITGADGWRNSNYLLIMMVKYLHMMNMTKEIPPHSRI